MKDAYYFSHDSNANKDPKILQMRSVYGLEGYGMFWVLIEMLREQSDYKLSIQGQYVWNAFAMQLQCDAEKATKFINDCINEFCLFETDGQYFWSNSLLNRMEQKEVKSKKARQSALKRWNKDGQANALQPHTECNAIKESKVKEIKEKEIKEEDDTESTQPEELFPPEVTQAEKECLYLLKHTVNYPYDYQKDLTLIRDLLTEFPQVNLLEELKKWAHRKKYDEPLDKKSKPRGQIRNWLTKAKDFSKNKSFSHSLRAGPKGLSAVNRVAEKWGISQ